LGEEEGAREVRGIPRKVEVLVPRAVREDLVNQVVEFCLQVYGRGAEKALREQFRRYVDSEKWDVYPALWSETGDGANVKWWDGEPRVCLSFPAGLPYKFTMSRRRMIAKDSRDEISLAEATKEAKRVFLSVADAERRDAYRLARKDSGYGSYEFRWGSSEAKGHSARVCVRVHKVTGLAWNCIVSEKRPPRLHGPLKSRKEMEEVSRRAFGSLKPNSLDLFVMYLLGRPMLFWQYVSPARPGGLGLMTNWDALTGELVSSNAGEGEGHKLDDQGDELYTNPKYYPQSKEEIIKGLEESALARARELEARKGGE